MNKLIYVSESV